VVLIYYEIIPIRLKVTQRLRADIGKYRPYSLLTVYDFSARLLCTQGLKSEHVRSLFGYRLRWRLSPISIQPRRELFEAITRFLLGGSASACPDHIFSRGVFSQVTNSPHKGEGAMEPHRK
jgi:hypothetical protein